MTEENDKNNNAPTTYLNKWGLMGIYAILSLLYFFCCSINSIVREKKNEIIEKLEIFKKDIDLYGIILQFGRFIGSILIISYALIFKNFKNMEYITPISAFLKSFCFFLIYFFDLKNYIKISIFFQGIFHSLVNIFFPIWINHFIDYKIQLLLLSISIGLSPSSDIFGISISKYYNIKICSLLLLIIILILTIIFLMIACFYNNYFDLTISINRKTGGYEKNKEKNKEYIKKMNFEEIFGSKNENRWPFISIVLARAILKFSLVGIKYCMKDYYDELDGDEILNEKLIFYFPLIGLIIGAIISFSEWFKNNSTIVIISFLIGIGITGVLICFSNKCFFEILIIIFYSLTNLIMPFLIQKSFDCFEDKQDEQDEQDKQDKKDKQDKQDKQDRQLNEISYAFNCFFYLLIGNLFSSGLNYFFQTKSNDLMHMYLLIVWTNLLLIFFYEKNKKITDSSNNSIQEELQLIEHKSE